MAGGALKDSLDRLLRTDRTFPKLPERMRRPAIFALLFWSVLAVTCVSYAFGLNREEHRFGTLPVVLLVVVLVAAWAVLPWDPRASWRRKLAVPLFLLCVLATGYSTESVWSLGLYAITFANAVFLFGFGWGIVCAAATLPVVFANYVLVLTARFSAHEALFAQALGLTAMWIPVVAFLVGVCAAIVEAVRRREVTLALLTELETAHSELQRYAERSRELVVSEERARMAREVHDSMGHHLTAINLQLQNAERFRDKDPKRAWERVREAKDLALSSLAEVRRSVRALKPPALEEMSGPGALAALARSFEGAGPAASFAVQGEECDLGGEVELALYRAMQEGLTNAARHSGARNVRATLAYDGETVRLAVADDGDGGRSDKESLEDGFGLASLRERVEALGGSFSAASLPEGGFALRVELPAGKG